MTRTPTWHRWYEAYAGGALQSSEFKINLVGIEPGQTVVRNRMNYLCSHPNQFAAEAVGIPVVVAMIVVEGLDPSVGDVPNPVTDPNADWLLVDDGQFLPYSVTSGDGTIFEEDVATPLRGMVDSKAQRSIQVESSLWLCAAIDDGLSAQGSFYFSYSGSTLLLV